MPSRKRAARAALMMTVLSLALAGCESMDSFNPFVEKEKKLPGARVPVFPEGVPGVDYSAKPPQPANSGYDYAAPAPDAAGAPALANSPAAVAAPR